MNSPARTRISGISGACSWLLSFPLDTVKTGVQGAPLTTRVSAQEAAVALLRAKGLAGLYRGALPSVLRAFLVSGTRFSTYECALALLRRTDDAATPLAI